MLPFMTGLDTPTTARIANRDAQGLGSWNHQDMTANSLPRTMSASFPLGSDMPISPGGNLCFCLDLWAPTPGRSSVGVLNSQRMLAKHCVCVCPGHVTAQQAPLLVGFQPSMSVQLLPVLPKRWPVTCAGDCVCCLTCCTETDHTSNRQTSYCVLLKKGGAHECSSAFSKLNLGLPWGTTGGRLCILWPCHEFGGFTVPDQHDCGRPVNWCLRMSRHFCGGMSS
jgi:hypothetical protein